ncbi:MAG: DegV family protein [Chloroflexota bacterium]|nr:DegV family protein [Chloroflexota bacterium]
MAIKVVTDTGCDLPASLLEAYDIHTVPLILRLGDEEMLDTETSREELWHHLDAGLPFQTSGPPVGAYEAVYRPLVEAGHEVVCIALTGAHSVTYSSAWAAAQSFGDRISVFDSCSLSLGYGLLTLEAARLAADGADRDTIMAAMEEMRGRLQVRFFLENLDQIQRGGRLAALMPVIKRLGRTLNIRAILILDDEGRITLMGPARGRRGAIRRLINEAVADGPLEQAVVGHVRRPDEALAMADTLATRSGLPRDQILVIELGAVFVAHAGDGILGVGTIAR